MKIEVEVRGADKLDSTFNNICNKLLSNASNSLENTLEQAKEYAQKKLQSSKPNRVIYEVESESGSVKGKLKTNMPIDASGVYKSYAPMREYGTGRLGELGKIGKTKTFIKSGYSYWLLPKEKAPRDFGASKLINIDGNLFYMMFSQSPRPFFRPTAFWLKNEGLEKYSDALKKEIRGDIK